MAKSSERLVLIHTGKIPNGTYQMFERADLDTMSNASGFVLTPCTKYEVYGENYKDHYPLLINQMKELPKKSFYVGLPPMKTGIATVITRCCTISSAK